MFSRAHVPVLHADVLCLYAHVTDAIVLTCWHAMWYVAPDDLCVRGGVAHDDGCVSGGALSPMTAVCAWWCVAPDDGGVRGGVLRTITAACQVVCCTR